MIIVGLVVAVTARIVQKRTQQGSPVNDGAGGESLEPLMANRKEAGERWRKLVLRDDQEVRQGPDVGERSSRSDRVGLCGCSAEVRQSVRPQEGGLGDVVASGDELPGGALGPCSLAGDHHAFSGEGLDGVRDDVAVAAQGRSGACVSECAGEVDGHGCALAFK